MSRDKVASRGKHRASCFMADPEVAPNMLILYEKEHAIFTFLLLGKDELLSEITVITECLKTLTYFLLCRDVSLRNVVSL